LEAENGVVCRYYVYSGDQISPVNAFAEQNTIWRKVKGKGGEPDMWFPRAHDPARQLWRDFTAIASQDDTGNGAEKNDTRNPGVVQWLKVLMSNRFLPKEKLVGLRIVANRYNDNPTSRAVEDLFSDQLTIHADLLSELGVNWRRYIEEEIEICDKGAYALGILARELNLAAGGDGENCTQRGKTQFYDAIDQPFRDWLAGLSAQQNRGEMVSRCDDWRREACAIGLRLGEHLVDEAGPAAFVGRAVELRDKKEKKLQGSKVYYAAPDSYRKYGLYIRWNFKEKEGNG
jgi:CRISPR system Cascade subunit CasA